MWMYENGIDNGKTGTVMKHRMEKLLHFCPNVYEFSPGLVVLVVFVFPWGLEHPGVFLPGGLLTQGCFQVA